MWAFWRAVEIHMEFPDGCVLDFRAPQVLCIEPGHDGVVVGNEPAVVIEFDFGSETVEQAGDAGKARTRHD